MISVRPARWALAHATRSARVVRGGPFPRCCARTAARLSAVRARSRGSMNPPPAGHVPVASPAAGAPCPTTVDRPRSISKHDARRTRNTTMMSKRDIDGIPARLWTRVSCAPHRLLMLDYDGTLAPFRVARGQAAPPARVLKRLGRLARAAHTRVAVVSGRPIDELDPLLGALPIALFGEHGWEERGLDGR